MKYFVCALKKMFSVFGYVSTALHTTLPSEYEKRNDNRARDLYTHTNIHKTLILCQNRTEGTALIKMQDADAKIIWIVYVQYYKHTEKNI